MCFSDPIDNHGVPQASWLIYLADQRPRHRKNYGKGGKYGTQVRATGGGWRGRDDPRYTPTPPAEHRGDGRGDEEDGFVYPPGPRQGRGGGGGRVRVPPGVNAGRGNGGASVASGGSGRGARGPAPRGGQGEEPAGPVVRDFGAEGGDAGTQAGGMGFDEHTVRTATILSNSSSGVGSGAGARSRAGTGTGGRGRGGGGDDGPNLEGRPAVSPPSSATGSRHSRNSHRSGSGRHAEGVPGMRSRSRHGSVSSGGGSGSESRSGSGHGRRGRGGERLGRVSEASGEGGWDDG